MGELVGEILLGLVSTSLVALVGFVWKFSHKVTRLENEARTLRNRIGRMESDHNKVMDKMFSMAKSRADFVSRDTYNRDKLVEQALDAARRNVRPTDRPT
jgi:hypothetical protein